MINPWDESLENLISLSSGAIAGKDVTADLLSAETKGKEAADEFIRSRLVTKEKDVFAPIKSFKLKSFATRERTTSKSQQQTKVLKTDRMVFARLLAISESRDFDMKTIMGYSFSHVSLPLSTVDGALCKTTKAALLDAIESTPETSCLHPQEELTETALMVDAMALIQSLSAADIPDTFQQLSNLIIKRLLSLATQFHATRVDFVGDRYFLTSIKGLERNRRGSSVAQIAIRGGDQKLPRQWTKFLKCGENKEALLTFLHDSWVECTLHVPMTIYVTRKEHCSRLVFEAGQKPCVHAVDELRTDHEEADTRLILHGVHANTNHRSVTIRSPDTDVAIICLSHAHHFKQLFFATGTKQRQRIIDITKLSSEISFECRNSLIGLHVLTGCDTTSSFSGNFLIIILPTCVF